MHVEDEDPSHPYLLEFLQQLGDLKFADRYYAYCFRHMKRGPKIPLALQISVLAEPGRKFRYSKKEKFFAWRDSKAPAGCELGLNVSLESACVEWILLFKTHHGHLGMPCSGLALSVKQTANPSYKHNRPYPTPDVASSAEVRGVLSEGLAMYDEIAEVVASRSWK